MRRARERRHLAGPAWATARRDIRRGLRKHARKMDDGTLLMILSIPAGLAFGFGIWAGLGYPGRYEKYERTGRVPRESPLRWLLRGGRRPLTSEIAEREKQQAEEEAAAAGKRRTRPSFDRGRRFRR